MGREVLKPSADSTTGNGKHLTTSHYIVSACVRTYVRMCALVCVFVSVKEEKRMRTSPSGLHNAHGVQQHVDLSDRSIPRLFNI